jgi:hypothetical protein
MAAVLYWRLPALTPTNPGPLPWLPGHSTNASCPSCLGRLHGTAIPRADERHAAHTAPRRGHDDRQRPHQQRERRPSGPSAPGR